MFVQQSCFTLHSACPPLDELPEHQTFLTKLLIPSGRIRDLALELDVCGFRKGDIFPDLQHLAEELRDRRLGVDA